MRGCGGLDECRVHEGPCSLAAALGGGTQVGAAGQLERGQGPAGVATLPATKIELEAVSHFPSQFQGSFHGLLCIISVEKVCFLSVLLHFEVKLQFFPGCF